MPIYDAIIVGAGPAGSATAALFARRGLRVLLVERCRFPRAKPCAEYLSPQTSQILQNLGATEILRRESPARLRGMRIVSADRTSFTGWFDGAHGFRAHSNFGIALPRKVLDARLAEVAVDSGATLLDGTTVERMSPAGPRCRQLLIRQGHRASIVSGRLIVGADGINSHIAKQMGVSRRGRLRRIALVSHAHDVAGMHDIGEMHVGRVGYAGIAPVGGGLTNLSIVIDLKHARVSGASVLVMQDLLRQFFPEIAARMADARFVSPVLGAGPFSRHTTTACSDRALLVGDAADFYDPFTGEGIFTALRGAELLAGQALAAIETDKLSASDLTSYDTVRRHEFGGKWKVERMVAWFVGHPLALNHVARRLAAKQRLADLLIGVAGDFVPPGQVLRPQFFWQLVR
ncbi:MAG: NAD(P)/FAD-dependent oxidoreductase [Gemmatimonadales bacterium]